MVLWCLQSDAWHENCLSQWRMCFLLCFVHSYSIEISAFVWFFTLYSCQTTQKWQAILAKAIAVLLHSTLIRISSGSILIYTFSGITGTCCRFWSQIQPHWAIRDGSQHTCIVTTYLIIHLMFLLCWSSSLSLLPDFSFSGKTTKIIILSVAFPQSLLF